MPAQLKPRATPLIIPHFDWIPLINCLQVCFITVCSSAVSMLVVLSLPLAVRTMNTYYKNQLEAVDELLWH